MAGGSGHGHLRPRSDDSNGVRHSGAHLGVPPYGWHTTRDTSLGSPTEELLLGILLAVVGAVIGAELSSELGLLVSATGGAMGAGAYVVTALSALGDTGEESHSPN